MSCLTRKPHWNAGSRGEYPESPDSAAAAPLVACAAMADASTIASLATAGGTLILAIATFSSTRSANRAARISEQALKVGLRPVLFNARPQDPPQKVGFADNHWLLLRDGLLRRRCTRRSSISRCRCAMWPRGWRCCTHGISRCSRRGTGRAGPLRSFAGWSATSTCPPGTSASGRPPCAIPPIRCTHPCGRPSSQGGA